MYNKEKGGELLMQLNFTEQQVQQLKVFLSRVDLKGSESMTHAILMQELNKPQSQPVVKPEPKKKKK